MRVSTSKTVCLPRSPLAFLFYLCVLSPSFLHMSAHILSPLLGVQMSFRTDPSKGTPLLENATNPLWEGMSGFNRLFWIMANATEEDFPRRAMADFLGVWSEMWDNPNGSHMQKLHGMHLFYDKYASVLGQDKWAGMFDTDTRFLLNALGTEKASVCHGCNGTGEARFGASRPYDTIKAPTQPYDYGSGGGGKGGGKGGGGKGGGGKGGAGGKGKRQEGPCSSMLVQSGPCTNDKCTREHSPCQSCKGQCANASACAGWDNDVVYSKHSDAIDRILAANARNGNKRKR
jgi:hypothetical protein